jgi:hypothetical protein
MKTHHKLIAAPLVIAAAVVQFLVLGYADWHHGGSAPYVGGLLFLYFSREEIEDERVRALKLQALTVAFVAGFGAAVLAKLLVAARLVSSLPRVISAFDFMFVMLVVAFGLYHFWRWQDGRAAHDAT